MNHEYNVEKIIKNFNVDLDTNPRTDESILNELIETQQKSKKTYSASPRLNTWRIIMKNKITKLTAAAAAIILLLLITQSLFHNATATAYTLEQSLAAEKNIRSVHLRIEVFNEDIDPGEYWYEFDENGNVLRFRYQYGPNDDFGIQVYQDQLLKTRSRTRNEFIIEHSYGVNAGYKNISVVHDPKSTVETVYNLEKQGKVTIECNQLDSGDIELKVTPLIDQQDFSSTWNYALNILIIDPKTKLVKQHDLFYTDQDNTLVHKSRYHYLEYNQTFDTALFDLEPPEGAVIVNLTQVNIGMPQGDLTDSQAAAEVVKRFIEARIARDWDKCAQLYNSSTPQQFLRHEERTKTKATRFIATGEPVPNPAYGPRAYNVTFAYEFENLAEGKLKISGPYEKDLPAGTPISAEDLKNFRYSVVVPVANRPDHWIIVGGL